MTQTSLLNPAHRSPVKSSRLLRFLAELLDVDVDMSHQRFVERLGQSFDLADSIRISAVHEQYFATAARPAGAEAKAIKEEFLHTRAAITDSAMRSFVPGSGALRLRFPHAHAEAPDETALTLEPYLDFYVAQQRNIDFRVRDLHLATRDAIACLSPQLARLAALDAVLADPLSATARQSFAAIPRLLRQRFTALRKQHMKDGPAGTNAREYREPLLRQFRTEMQGLLLAEIDARLLPTQGLVEALDDNDDD